MFNKLKTRQAFFKSIHRDVVIRPKNIHSDIAADELYKGKTKITFKFFLPRGSYATMLIHDIEESRDCEYEPGLIQDLKELFNKLLPAGPYHHDQRWHDGNGHSHLRASLIGPSITLPFTNHQLILGTWQQIIFIDFDNRGRQRKLILQFLGE